MARILIIGVLLLGGACPVQLPSSHLIVTSSQTLYDSHLISCTATFPDERVTQLHWKERHPNGKYNTIAVLNALWGNATQHSYQLVVKLSKMDDATYTLEMAEAGKVVCCEVVTFPSGMVLESCLTVEGDSDSGGGNIESALLGTLLVSGIFLFGSAVLICHICWTKKSSRRIFNLRGASEEVWNRGQRSRVPYIRTPPSTNLAYEPPIDVDLLNNATHLHHAEPTIQLPFEGPPTSAPQNHHIPSPRNLWLSENIPVADHPSYTNSSSVGPPMIRIIPEHASTENPIYSNVRRHNRQHLKALQNTQNQPVGDQHQPEMIPFERSTPTQTPFSNPFCLTSATWLYGDRSFFPEEASPLQPTRLGVPRTPDTPFTTNNPMYHSRPAWAPQPSTAHFKHQHSTLS